MRSPRLAALIATLIVASAANASAGEPSPPIARGLEVGAALDASTLLGAASKGTTGGYTARPWVGYELDDGLALVAGASYSRWGTDAGDMWELSARAGVRYGLTLRRFLPWVEGALGYGQLVYANALATDIGPRMSGGVGLDFVVIREVRAGVHLGLERLQVGAPSSPTTWLDGGFTVTFFPL